MELTEIPDKTKKGYVYVLCDSGNSMFKIGVTKGKLAKRIKQLQTGNSNEIHLSDYFETDYPFQLEHMLHVKYTDKSKIGEWFELQIEDLSDFKEICTKYEETLLKLKKMGNPYIK